jgi:Nuclease-related domain/AAA domain
MARIIPPHPGPDAPYSERKVREALGALPAPWVVLCDIPIGIFGRLRPGMTQLDFLLIHPKLGLCVLEVKGGTIEVAQGTWYQTSHNGERHELPRSPFAQATSQRYEIQRFLWNRGLSVPKESMAHAVAFPDCVVESALGPDGQRSIIVDRVDLENIERSVQRVMKQWKATAALSEDDVEHIISALLPSAVLTVVLAAEVAITEEGLQRETRKQVAFTESQAAVYDELLRSQRMVVIGEAGTGKTVLATERAKRLVETGMSTLLLCHRATVAAFIRTSLGGGTRSRLKLDAPSDLTVAAFTELVTAMAEQTGREYHAPHGRDLPDWMLSAVEDLGLHFDALVIDEAQEFTSGQFDALVFLLTDPDEGPFYLFADPFQHSAAFSSGRGRASKGRYNWIPPEGFPLTNLVNNVRNSKPIAETVRHFLAEQQSVASVNGPEPEVIRCPRGSVLSAGLERVKRLTTTEKFSANQLLLVAVDMDKDDVLGAASRHGIEPVDVSTLWRFPLPPTDIRVALGRPDDVQGIEAEIVLVLYDQRGMTLAAVRDLYVAASRARSHLIFVTSQPMQELYVGAMAALREAEK